MLGEAKQLAIKVGLYKPARAIHRMLSPSERQEFRAYKALLSTIIKPNDLAFDVGANIGNRTEALLSVGARVVAFEPQPICAREIRARGNNRLVVVESAVGASKGGADLHVKQSNTHSSLLPNWEGSGVGTLRVPVTTLDDAIAKHGRPRYCKIDVEGYEIEVFKGLSTALPIISFEFSSHSDVGVQRARDCLQRLSEIGDYEVNFVSQDTAKLMLPDWLPMSAFREIFPDCTLTSFWGDIFVRQR